MIDAKRERRLCAEDATKRLTVCADGRCAECSYYDPENPKNCRDYLIEMAAINLNDFFEHFDYS